jgi:hypothetical protein
MIANKDADLAEILELLARGVLDRLDTDQRNRLTDLIRLFQNPKRYEDEIMYVAEYDDGSTERFKVEKHALGEWGGSSIAKMIATEMQEGGRLRVGKIVRVHRVP